jgi:hypothetical protein
MNDARNDDTGGRGRPRRAAPRAVALAALVLLVGACGGGGSSAAGGLTPYQQALAYAQCMRSHDEPGFPDPDSQGLFQNLGPVDIRSPQYLSATKACGHLLPADHLSAAQRQQDLSRQLKYAGCMRSHGFPNTPDPVLMPNGNIEGAGPGGAAGPGGGIDTNSPQYNSAQHTCQPFLTGAES